MNKYKELPIEFWEKKRPRANKYQEALDVFEEYVSYLDEHKMLDENKLKYLYNKLDLLKELVVMQSVFKELYNEYVVNEKGDTLTEGAKQLASSLESINDSIELAIHLNKSEKR